MVIPAPEPICEAVVGCPGRAEHVDEERHGLLTCEDHRGPTATSHSHTIATLTGRGPDGRMVGARVCIPCNLILAWLPVCNARTKRGTPCRVAVRTDLGYTRRWSHGEDAGRTSTPRRAS